ncbi:MAG: ADP-glyceromanno-heptose 6-epimerase [Candidatus Euphemobacter frigidus]|nr:ADP-glyceromanno-heptose 6-epimerase [Candidatus Euphemobacter frigidus]MDP8275181.1 ADP-glyceromanno-heptose 6-epimerase [Candidatus Euphemobacter frigidus]
MKEMIVVTGGAGFIGSALVWKLNQLGQDNILVVDSLGSGDKWRNIAGLRFADYMEKDDFREAVISRSLPGSIKTIFHLGACSSTTEADLRYLIKNNYEYSKVLAEFALAAGVRLIYASSAATYGDGTNGYSDNISKLSLLRPLNGYGFSKHIFDLRAYRQGWLEKIVGLKFFNVFGPNEYHKGSMRSMVCKGYEQIAATGKINLFSSYRDGYPDGEQERDFIYIKDAVEMVVFIYEHPKLHGIFNIGSGSARTWNTLADALFEAMEVKPQIEYIPMLEEIKETYQYHTEAEMTRLRRSGYDRPVTALPEAVADYVKNYLIPGRYL